MNLEWLAPVLIMSLIVAIVALVGFGHSAQESGLRKAYHERWSELTQSCAKAGGDELKGDTKGYWLGEYDSSVPGVVRCLRSEKDGMKTVELYALHWDSKVLTMEKR